jgi:hypothetical protein
MLSYPKQSKQRFLYQRMQRKGQRRTKSGVYGQTMTLAEQRYQNAIDSYQPRQEEGKSKK